MMRVTDIFRSAIFCSLILSRLASGALAHDGEEGHVHEVIAVGPAQMYEPSPIPDRIVLTWNGDPRTSQAVNWRSSVAVKTGLAEIAIAEAGPNYPENAKTYVAVSEALKTDLNTAHFHSVTFQDLQPGTRYAYRVGDGVNWSEWFQFSTAAAEDEPFSFVYFGDAQNSVRSMWSRVIREAYRDAPKAAFLLHAGDLINRAESDGEWGEWFGAGGWLNAMTPSIAVPGNHEQARTLLGMRRLSHHWRPSFTFPENGPPGLEETCYTLTYHNLRIIALNSNTMLEEQAGWLDEVLSENRSQWVVCTFHHPVFSTGKGRDNPQLRAAWKPVFDKYKVDLVLQGHDHTYGRTGLTVPDQFATGEDAPAAVGDRSTQRQDSPGVQLATAQVGDVNVPTGVQKIDAETGTVYVVSVSGPKMYNNTRYEFMRRLAEDTQLYQIIHIDGGRLRFEARTAIGELYDAFELHKQPGAFNKLVELEPEVGQNLRPLVDQQ
jgi:acid phosphatase type 7